MNNFLNGKYPETIQKLINESTVEQSGLTYHIVFQTSKVWIWSICVFPQDLQNAIDVLFNEPDCTVAFFYAKKDGWMNSDATTIKGKAVQEKPTAPPVKPEDVRPCWPCDAVKHGAIRCAKQCQYCLQFPESVS